MANNISSKQLSLFLKLHLEENNQKQSDFIKVLADLIDNEKTFLTEEDRKKELLDKGVFSRILKSKTEASEDTLLKIAKIVFNRLDATIEQLAELIEQKTVEYFSSDENNLLVGIGFTVWSSYIVSLLKTSPPFPSLPQNVKLIFCDEKVGENEYKPFYVSTSEDLEEIENHPEKFKRKYIANDLLKLLNEGKIDCAFLLRTSFEELDFVNKPIMVSRIAVGYGSHIYVIKKKESEEKNEIVECDDLSDEINEAKKRFCELVYGKEVRITYIGNRTIRNELDKFLKYRDVQNSLKNLLDVESIDFVTDKYEKSLEKYRDFFVDEKQMLLIVAFEPLNNMVYHDIANLCKQSGVELIYYNFNLSKLINDKLGYCLFSSVEAIRDDYKLKKISELLNAIDQNKVNQGVVSGKLANFYFNDNPDDNSDIPKIERINESLKGLEFRNHYLPFIDLVTSIITEK